MKVGLTFDCRTDWVVGPNDPQDLNAEFDKPQTIDDICSAIESGGHEVVRIGNAEKLRKTLDQLDIDIVLNLCEGRHGRNRESQVPVLLEMKGIPFVGADALTLGLTLDKSVAKKCFIADGIPTPRFFVADETSDLEALNTIGFPLIVKTCYEGTSKGITEASRVSDLTGLRRQVQNICRTYNQPAMVEEFISGRELTVPVLGNDDPQAMIPIQVSINDEVELGDRFYSFEMVISPDLRYVCPPKISQDLKQRLQKLAVRVYKSVECRDFGRVDFRIDGQGNPYVLEINPLPSLSKEDVFNVFPQVMGSSYEAAINQVLNIAARRCGLSTAQEIVQVT